VFARRRELSRIRWLLLLIVVAVAEPLGDAAGSCAYYVAASTSPFRFDHSRAAYLSDARNKLGYLLFAVGYHSAALSGQATSTDKT
jgi:hypothetical protein